MSRVGELMRASRGLSALTIGETSSAQDFFASLGITDFDPLGWMGNDQSWMGNFGDLLEGDGSGASGISVSGGGDLNGLG